MLLLLRRSTPPEILGGFNRQVSGPKGRLAVTEVTPESEKTLCPSSLAGSWISRPRRRCPRLSDDISSQLSSSRFRWWRFGTAIPFVSHFSSMPLKTSAPSPTFGTPLALYRASEGKTNVENFHEPRDSPGNAEGRGQSSRPLGGRVGQDMAWLVGFEQTTDIAAGSPRSHLR